MLIFCEALTLWLWNLGRGGSGWAIGPGGLNPIDMSARGTMMCSALAKRWRSGRVAGRMGLHATPAEAGQIRHTRPAAVRMQAAAIEGAVS